MRSGAVKAYTAGFIDGEGCIRVQHSKARDPRQYLPQIKVSSTKPASLEFLVAHYGGWIRGYQPNDPSGNDNVSKAYEWQLQGRSSVQAIMEDILPFVITKRPQVELMLAFILEGEISKPPTPISDQELARREAIFQQFGVLNKRGRK